METSEHVVIIGAGFAGLKAAKQFRGSNIDVTIVDRNNYHKFQPLLYEVAMAGLEADDIAYSVRKIFASDSNINFRMATVTGLDEEKQCVHFDEAEPLYYDYLIMAAGASTNFFGVPGAKEHSFPIKNIPDATQIRNQVLTCLEEYDRNPSERNESLLNFVVVGGGPTGVEIAGALSELMDVVKHEYPHNCSEKASIHIIEMLPNLLSHYPQNLSDYTRNKLESRGVTVRTELSVDEITSESVMLSNGETIESQTLIWAAGVKANPVSDVLEVEKDRSERIKVNSHLQVSQFPNIYVIGDMAHITDSDGSPLPQLAPVAVQSGKHAAKNVFKSIHSQPLTEFSYLDKGTMATIGRNAAVVDLHGFTFKGWFAWIVWVFLHIFLLIGFRNRFSVFSDWIVNYLMYDRHARLILD